MSETTADDPRIRHGARDRKCADPISPRFESWIRRTTTASVLLLAGIAAVVSFRHMHELALKHGEDELAAALIPLAVDGTIVAASMSLLLASRTGSRGSVLPWTLLMISSLASLGANIAVAEPTLIGRLIAGWPSLALIGAYEMLMSQIRMLAKTKGSGTRAERIRNTSPAHDAARRPGRRTKESDRALQRAAWQWAQTNLGQDGKIPSGLAIARNFERSPRWGRLVKKAGLAGELA